MKKIYFVCTLLKKDIKLTQSNENLNKQKSCFMLAWTEYSSLCRLLCLAEDKLCMKLRPMSRFGNQFLNETEHIKIFKVTSFQSTQNQHKSLYLLWIDWNGTKVSFVVLPFQAFWRRHLFPIRLDPLSDFWRPRSVIWKIFRTEAFYWKTFTSRKIRPGPSITEIKRRIH